MADVDWPLPNTHKPVIDSFTVSVPALLRRVEMDDGEDRVRRTATQRPTQVQAQIDIGLADLATLRRWIEEDIDQGRLWFNLLAWVDDAYQWIEARLVGRDGGLVEVTLIDEITYRVALTYEVRQLPRQADAAYQTALVGGPAELDALFDAFDRAINVELRDAAA